MSGNCPAEWCTYSSNHKRKLPKQLVASLVLSLTSRHSSYFPNRFVFQFLPFFSVSEHYILSGPNADLRRQRTAQLADEKVKGAGPHPNAITSSHPSSSHPHNEQ